MANGRCRMTAVDTHGSENAGTISVMGQGSVRAGRFRTLLRRSGAEPVVADSWKQTSPASSRRARWAVRTSSVPDRCHGLSSLGVPPLTRRGLPALRQPLNRAAGPTFVHRRPMDISIQL